MKAPLFTLVLFLLTIRCFAQETPSTETQRPNGVTVSDTVISGVPFKNYQYYFVSPDLEKNYSMLLPMPENAVVVSKIRHTLLGKDYTGNYEKQLREEFAADSLEAALHPIAEGEEPKSPYENENYFSAIYVIFPMSLEGDLISFSSYFNEYYGGALHPMAAYLYYTFNLSTGKQITEDDILDVSEEKRYIVARKLYTLLREFMGEEDDGEQDVLYMLNNNFYFTDKELVYAYTPYEVAPYMYGEPELSLPKQWLKPYLKTDSLLYQYWFGKKGEK